MKVFLSVEDIEAEITVRGAYSPDVLSDLCNRITELVITQRATDLVLASEDD